MYIFEPYYDPENYDIHSRYLELKELVKKASKPFDAIEGHELLYGGYKSMAEFVENYTDFCSRVYHLLHYAEHIEDYEFCQELMPALNEIDVKEKKAREQRFGSVQDKFDDIFED